jgi:hypothetical protein
MSIRKWPSRCWIPTGFQTPSRSRPLRSKAE